MHLKAIIAAFLLTLLSSSVVYADPRVALTASAQKTVVFISSSYYDPATDSVKPGEEGTGVIVSSAGDFLTDNHVIKDWLAQSDENKKRHPLRVSIEDRGNTLNEVIYLGSDPDKDLSLFRLLAKRQYAHAAVCYEAQLASSQDLEAYGFPDGGFFTPEQVSFSNDEGEEGRYSAVFQARHGMSGGPVFDVASGKLVGLVEGGVDESVVTNFITPLRWAKALIESKTLVKQDCSGAGPTPIAPHPSRLFDVRVAATPDTVAIDTNGLSEVDFAFTQNSDFDMRVLCEDSQWRVPDGRAIGAADMCGRILGGSFVVKANSTGILRDNIYLPADVVAAARSYSSDTVELEQTFHFSDADGHEGVAPALVRIRLSPRQ